MLRAVGDSKTPLIAMATASIVNIALDIVAVFLLKMGIAGAAAATVISEGIAGVCCLIYMLRKISVLHFDREDLAISRKHISLLLRNGIPMALQNVIIFFGAVIMQIAINSLGGDVI